MADDEDLDALRVRIDRLDTELVDLINQRASVVVRIGALKRDQGGPIYAPARESAVLERVRSANHGPLRDRALEAIYRELMSGSFALERPLRIGFLGPDGSFSHDAAIKHFGSSVAFENLHEIEGVFTEVQRGHVDYGLVPIENSIGGGISETLEAFRDGGGGPSIVAEVLVAIRHNLLANCEPREVQVIHSKPEIFAQCRRWVRTQYPRAEQRPAPSSSAAARLASEAWAADRRSGDAAIGSRLAGELYGLRVLFDSIEDEPDNLTRFFIIGREAVPATGDDKTSIMFRTENEPGALARVLTAFAERGINLTHIDKRPGGREQWSYAFFIDARGHRDDPALVEALDAARQSCHELTVLGSYPAARTVL